MTIWTRALYDTDCRCGQPIKRGDPLMFIQFPRVKRQLRRCQHCAWEAPPADLPLLAEPPPLIPVDRWVPIGQAARDWKVKQSGDGEDES